MLTDKVDSNPQNNFFNSFTLEVARLIGVSCQKKIFHITVAYNRYKTLPQELIEERNKFMQNIEECVEYTYKILHYYSDLLYFFV